ncbi:MAG: hypothetical protein ACE5JG_02010, partial [Planctomycetota bacterium]
VTQFLDGVRPASHEPLVGVEDQDPVALEARQVGRALQVFRRRAQRPGYRTPVATLRRLAQVPLFFDLGRRRTDVLGVLDLGGVGLAVTDLLARRFGSRREEAARTCAREAAALLGARAGRRTRGERLAWERWGPLVLALPGVARWSAADRRALARVVRAKGGRRESDYALLLNRHTRLRRAILRLA